MRRQQHRLRHGHADLGRERVVEKFFVGAPPKGIVHDRGAGERRILEPGPIKRHVLRDAVDHDVVAARLALDDFVDLNELRDDVFAAGFLVHPLDKCRRKAAFLSEEDSDFFHSFFHQMSSRAKLRDL